MQKKTLLLFVAAGLAAWLGLSAGNKHPLDEVYSDAGKPAPPADNLQVLRRMSLQLRGTIPLPAEVQEVEANPAALERYATFYISDPDFAHYWGIYFSSVFREQTRGRKTKYASFAHYIADSLHQNKPYDVWVREMLTAKGSAEENPAVDFYLRDAADPLQVAEFVGRTFYGSRVSCARCHDHPHMDFSRRDYYGLAAFFSQQFEVRGAWDPALLGGKAVPREAMENLPEQKRKEMEEKWREWQREWGKLSKDEQKAWRAKYEVKYATLHYSEDLGVRFPRSDDAPGGDLVAPKFPDGKTPRIRAGEDRRAVFAAWLTSADNARFRKVLINRVWTRLMGWSFFTPLDDWNKDTDMQGEEILNHLDKVFVEKGMRIKDLVHYIVTSNAYRRAGPGPSSADRQSAIVYFQPARLDPDQLFNSVLRAGGALEVKTGDVNERAFEISGGLSGRGTVLYPQEGQKTYTNAFQVPRPADDRTILAVFGSGDRLDISDDDRSITVEQVLTLQNGRFTGRISWDYGKPGSAVHQEYERTKDVNQAFELVFRSMLSRRMKPAEKSRLAEAAALKVGREKGDYRPELMQDLVWGIFNSQEFLHVR